MEDSLEIRDQAEIELHGCSYILKERLIRHRIQAAPEIISQSDLSFLRRFKSLLLSSLFRDRVSTFSGARARARSIDPESNGTSARHRARRRRWLSTVSTSPATALA